MTSKRLSYASLALLTCSLADFFGVTEKTLNNWKHEHPRFLQSLKKGKVFSDDKVEMALYDRAIGYEYDEVKEEQGEQGMKRTVTTKRYTR